MNTPPPIRAVPKTPNNGLGLGFNQDLLKNALANRRKGVNGSTPEDKNGGGGGAKMMRRKSGKMPSRKNY